MSSSAAPPALRCRTLREHALGGGVYKVTLRKAPAIVNGASTVAAKAGAAPSDVKVLKNPQHVPQDFQVVATIEVMEGCGSPCAIVTPRKGFEIKAEWPGAAEQAKTATLSVGIKRAIHCKTKLTVDKRVCVVFDSATMATVASTATATADLPSTLAILREEPLSTLFDGDGDGDADGTGKGRGRGRGRPRGSKNKKTTPQPQITVSPGVSVASGTTPSKSRSARGRGLCEEAGAAANAREETVSHQASRSAGGPSSLSAPSCAESDYSSNSGQGFTNEVSRQLPPAVMASSWGESHGLSGSSCTDEDANGRRAQPEQPDLSRLRPRSEGDGGEVRGSKEKVLPESGTGTGPAPRALTSDRATTVEQAPDNGNDANKSAGSPTFGDDTKTDDTRGGGRGITVPPGEIWRCARCTLLNDENQVRCGACLTVRPREDYHIASGTTPSKSRSARGRGLCEEAGAAANAREATVSRQASRSAGGPSSLSAPSCTESDYSSNSGQGFTNEVSRQLPPAVMASSWGESHGLSGSSCTDEDANGRRAQPEQPDLSRLRPRSEGDGGEVRGSKEKVLPESGTRTGPAPRALTSDRATTVEQAPDNGNDANKSAGSPTFGDDTKSDDTRGGGRGITVPPGEIWRCARCTLLNDENQVRCGACLTVRPREDYHIASGTTPSKSRSARGRGLGEEAGAAANAREETVSHQASRSAGGPSSLSAPSCAESDYSSNSGQGFTHEVSRQLPPAVMASSWGESHGLSGPSCTDEDANGRRAQPEQPDLSRLRPRSEGDGGEVRGSKEKVLPESGTRTGPAPRALTSDRAATVEQAPDNGDDTNKSAGSPTFGDDTRGGGRGITVPPGEIWRCARCTLLNDENQVRCGVCLTVRPREDYHLRRRRSEVPRFAEYQAARRIRQRNSAPARRSGPAGAVGAEGGDDGSSQDGAKEKTNGATKSTRRRTAGGRRNKVVRDGGAEVTSADRGDPLSSQQILLMFVEWASTPGPPCTLDTRALAEQAAWEVKGAQWPSREKCGAGSGNKSDRPPETISPRKRKIAASRSVTEEGQGKRQRLPGNDGPEGGERVEGTEVGGELSDTDTDVDMDQAKGESSEMALSEALAKSSRDPPGQNGSGAAHPSLAAGCTTTPEGEEYQGEGFLGPEGDGNGEYHDRYRSADEDDGSGETELEFDGVGSVDY